MSCLGNFLSKKVNRKMHCMTLLCDKTVDKQIQLLYHIYNNMMMSESQKTHVQGNA